MFLEPYIAGQPLMSTHCKFINYQEERGPDVELFTETNGDRSQVRIVQSLKMFRRVQHKAGMIHCCFSSKERQQAQN